MAEITCGAYKPPNFIDCNVSMYTSLFSTRLPFRNNLQKAATAKQNIEREHKHSQLVTCLYMLKERVILVETLLM